MKRKLCLLLVSSLLPLSLAVVLLEKVDIRVLDPTKGTCTVKINPGTPRTVDIDVQSFIEAKDITVSVN